MKRESHGLRRTSSCAVWCGIKTRCYNQNSKFYAGYGGRGILMCDRWRDSFVAFFSDMGERPDGLTIERVNNDMGYSAENCVWASRKAQSRNRRGRRYLTVDGETKTLAEWADTSGVSIRTMWARLDSGWSHERVVRTKVGGAGYGPKPKQKHATAVARGVTVYEDVA